MKRTRLNYSQSFKQQVLDDYFQSGMSQSACARKWKIHQTTISNWLSTCINQEKAVPLHANSIHMDAKDQAIADLRLENERLRKEVEYNKLRAAGYERLLEIVKQEDGIDLLKKDGAKQ